MINDLTMKRMLSDQFNPPEIPSAYRQRREKEVTDLPNEILDFIFQKISSEEKKCCALTCKLWYEIARQRQRIYLLTWTSGVNARLFTHISKGNAEFKEAVRVLVHQDRAHPNPAIIVQALAIIKQHVQLPNQLSNQLPNFSGDYLCLASDNLERFQELFFDDRNAVMHFIAINSVGVRMQKLAPELHKDKELVLANVSKNGNHLVGCTSDFQQDPDIRRAAECQRGISADEIIKREDFFATITTSTPGYDQ